MEDQIENKKIHHQLANQFLEIVTENLNMQLSVDRI